MRYIDTYQVRHSEPEPAEALLEGDAYDQLEAGIQG